jgi:uncharacterized secreted protein with C-terminal beta-propeller domain
MRRPVARFAFAAAMPPLLAFLMVAGCGGGGDDEEGGIEQPEVSGMLRKVRSASELEDSLKSSLPEVASPAAIPPGGGVTAAGDYNFSGTYTAEAGVDEFDYARYDGSHLYVAPTPWANTQVPRAIRILRTDPAGGTATQVSSIPIEGNQQVQGLYVANGRLVMLTSEANFSPYGEFWIALFVWAPTELAVHVFDVSVPANPTRILHAELDGVFVATRRVGDRVYLVTRHSPQVPRDPTGRLLLAGQTINDLLPKVTMAGRTSLLVRPSDCYITNGPDHHAYPILTTITAFSIQSPGDFASVCYNEPANGVYASTSALYVSQPDFDAADATSFTRIHKFALTETAPDYVGSVEVPGLLWMGGQQDFRMSEHQGMLRVVTTESINDLTDAQDHRLFVLRPKAGETALEVLSTLPNNAHPEEIGKPNDGLYGVRFVGDRAYAVTFRQVDPLYVLDLSNPADPRIAGELEIPGFNEFLHPVTENLLLGLGSEAGLATMELFDVSQIEHPQSRGRIVLDGYTSYLEATWDRHAFTWLPAESADRIAIPATITPRPQNNAPMYPQSSLQQFEILGKQSAGSASLRAAGVVTPPVANDYERYSNSARSFIHGDTVYYVRDGKVWSTSWFAPSQVQGPF